MIKLSAISNYVPNVRIATPREAANNLKKIALPAIVLVGASMIQGAKAITYVQYLLKVKYRRFCLCSEIF